MKKVSKINAILIELIVVALFFGIAAVITIQLFATSYSITTSSAAKTKLTLVVEKQMDEYRNKTATEGNRTFYYDENLNSCNEDKARYIEKIEAVNDANLPLIRVNVRVADSNDDIILSFDTSYERQV